MRNKPETTNKCDKCNEVRKARAYYRKLDGKWVNLCSACWQDEEHNFKVKPTDKNNT